MSSIKTLYIFIVMLSLISLCSSARSKIPSMEVFLDELSSNRSGRVRVGQNIEIVAGGEIDNGFEWYLDNAKDLDKAVLEPKNLNAAGSTDNFNDQNNINNIGYIPKRRIYRFIFNGKKTINNITLRFQRKNVKTSVVQRTVEVYVRIYN